MTGHFRPARVSIPHPDRLGQRVLLLCLMAIAATLLTACGLFRQDDPNLPVPLRELIPPEWQLLPKERGELGVQEISIDGDEDIEWLIFYYYDNPSQEGAHGPVGGVIYDAQQDTAPYDPQVVIPFPYQPSAFLVPYRLLPDWRAGKGQGYLAQANVSWDQTPLTTDGQNQELVVWGQGAGGIVTRLSIFWWQGESVGYGVTYFSGTHRVDTPNREQGQRVNSVVTLDSLNERSNLCSRVNYSRQGDTHRFDGTKPAIVFCQGTPLVPTYPEAVTLAWLLDRNSDLIAGGRETIIENAVPDNLDRVISLTYNGTATTTGVGNAADSVEVVYATLEQAGNTTIYWFHLIEQRPQTVGDTSRFLLYNAGPFP